MLGDSVEVVLDGGPSPKGEASTILDVRASQPRLLRLGAVSVAELNDVIQPLGATVVERGPDEE
jgi:tRNA A37 threonylcarbamoyladenosine synthetase subunit TsaC/SUA5/YrdC